MVNSRPHDPTICPQSDQSLVPSHHSLQPPVRWADADTALLDMDGTLLDLRFDNYFWLELVPERYAQRHSLTPDAARATLVPLFAAKRGTLDWYCTDFWSRELALDIAGLKREVREHVRFLPGAEQFLQRLRARGLRTVLVTNAHHDALAIKEAQTGLARYFDAMVSSHRYGVPKEDAQFWIALEQELRFDPARCVFIDDSLAVLRAARQHGIGQIFAIARPDSMQATRAVSEFAAIESVESLLATLD